MFTTFSNEEIETILETNFKINVGADYDKDFLTRLRNFEVRDSDVFLIGNAKTGTTWAQEMIWLIANNLNFDEAKKFIDERFPVLELCTFDTKSCKENVETPEYHTNSLAYIEKLKDPRFIKTHLRGTYLPLQIQNRCKIPKIIYITRNVKDTCLSLYYFWKNLIQIYTGNLDDFCKVFMTGRVGGGSYWDHALYFWERRNERNVLFIRYEDMKNNLSEVIRQVAAFLDKPLNEDQVTVLINWLDFESMKNNPALNHDGLYKQSGFIRKGKVDGFKEDMPVEWIERFDEWTKKCLEGSGLNMY